MHVCFGSVQELLAAESESLSLRAKKLFKYTYMYMTCTCTCTCKSKFFYFSIFALIKLQHYSLAAAHRAPCSGPPAGARGVSSLYAYNIHTYMYITYIHTYIQTYIHT